MIKSQRPRDIAKLLGCSEWTIKRWESEGLIQKARRQGIKKIRIWTSTQAVEILEFARSIGYSVPEWTINHVREGTH